MDPVSSHLKFTITETENHYLSRLKEFSDRVIAKQFDALPVTLLKDVCLDKYYDLVVQVVDKYRFVDPISYCVLRVSDGTEVPFNSFRKNGYIDEAATTDLLAATKQQVCDVSLFDDHANDASTVNVGDYIMLNNVHVRSVPEDILEHSKTTLQFSEKSDKKEWAEFVLETGKSYNRRQSLASCNNSQYTKGIKERTLNLLHSYKQQHHKDNQNKVVDTPTNVQTCFASTTMSTMPIQCITNILEDAKNTPNTYRLCGKILAIKPKNPKDFVISVCENCRRVNKNGVYKENEKCRYCDQFVLKKTIFLELLVEDETGIIAVEIYDDQAKLFLSGSTEIQFISRYSANGDSVECFVRQLQRQFEPLIKAIDSAKDMLNIESLSSIDLFVASFRAGHDDDVVYRVCGTTMQTKIL